MALRIAWTRFSPAGVSRYSLTPWPPKLMGGYSPFLTTSPLAAWNSEPTEMPRASHSLISEATEMFVRSRSSLDRKPLVRPLCSATSAMLLRAACLAARNCAPMRGEAGEALSSGTLPQPSLSPRETPLHSYGIPEPGWETSVDMYETSRHTQDYLDQVGPGNTVTGVELTPRAGTRP